MTIEVAIGLYNGDSHTWESQYLTVEDGRLGQLDEDTLVELLIKEYPCYEKQGVAFVHLVGVVDDDNEAFYNGYLEG